MEIVLAFFSLGFVKSEISASTLKQWRWMDFFVVLTALKDIPDHSGQFIELTQRFDEIILTQGPFISTSSGWSLLTSSK